MQPNDRQNNQPASGAAVDPFGPEVQPDRPAPTIDRELLRQPQIVQYIGARVIEYKKNGEDKRTRKQVFASAGGNGPWFSLWGTMNLDSQLRQVKYGAIVRITYKGQEADAAGNQPHLFSVQVANGTRAQLDALRAQDEWAQAETWLRDQIEKQRADDMAKRDAARADGAASGDDVPPHDDADLPF